MTSTGGSSFATATELTVTSASSFRTHATPVAGLSNDTVAGDALYNVAWWKFTITTSTVTTIDTNPTLPLHDVLRDTWLNVYQMPGGGTVQADLVSWAQNDDRTSGDDGSNRATSLVNLTLPAGTYYVVASSFDPDPSPITDYILQFGVAANVVTGSAGATRRQFSRGFRARPAAAGPYAVNPAPSTLGPGDPVWISQDNPGAIGEVEGDMCLLDSGLVAITTFSSDTFGLSQWVVRPGNPPTVGPMHFDSSDFDWTSTPGYESLGPADPQGQVVDDDLCTIAATGPYSWAITGQGGQNPSDASEYAVAAFYTVDPDTLVITRDHINYSDSAGYGFDEIYVARYGTSVAALAENGSGPTIAIAHADATTDTIAVPWPTYPTGGYFRPGPIAVVGDVVLMFDETLGISTWALDGSGQIDRITYDLSQDQWEWSMFTCPMIDGRVAVVTPGPTGVYSDSTLPVKVAIINLSPLAVDTVIDVASVARSVGWTGGWKSNVRSIQQMPDGTLLVSYVTSNVMYVVTVDPVTEAVGTPLALPFESFGGTTFVSRLLALGQNQYAAMFITSRPDQYGTWYLNTTTPATGIPTGSSSPTRQRFFAD